MGMLHGGDTTSFTINVTPNAAGTIVNNADVRRVYLGEHFRM